MTHPDPAARRVAFSSFVLDFTQRILEKDGRLLKLSPKVVETLMVLVENRGRVVPKEELVARLWPDTFVEEGGLQRNISLLRKGLQEHGGEDLIETVPKRGYRFKGELRDLGEDPQTVELAATQVGNLSAIEAASPQPSAPEGIHRGRRWWLFTTVLILAGTCVAWILAHQGNDSRNAATAVAAAPLVVEQMTRNSGELSVTAAAISPDGRSFAYYEGRSLRLREIASGAVSELPVPPEAQVLHLAWMPSAKEILLSVLNLRTRRTEIWRAFTTGSPPVKIIDDALLAAASPRGDRIAFTRGTMELWTTAADGSNAELFLEAPPDRLVYFRPAFSRDGKRLYVMGYGLEAGWHLTVYDVASRRPVFHSLVDRVDDFTLLDDATLLVSQASASGVQRGAYLAVMKLDFERQQVVETQRSPEWPYYRAYQLSATTDGRTFAFVRDQTQYDIYVAELARDGDSIANARRLTLDDGADRVTSWTADGRGVLFHASRDALLGIYRQNIDSPRAVQLRNDGRMNWQPVNSPDGRWLFYMSFAPGSFPSPDHPQMLMRKPLMGSAAPEPLAKSTHGIAAVGCARHAPRCIFLDFVDGKTVISNLDVHTGRIERLFTLPVSFVFNFNWSVSPDGRLLAYIERNSVGMRIGVRDLDAQGAMRTSLPIEGTGLLRSLTWDVAGTGWFAIQCVDEGGLLLHLDPKGGANVLRRIRSSCDGWALPSPDGSRLAFVEATSTGNLWMGQR